MAMAAEKKAEKESGTKAKSTSKLYRLTFDKDKNKWVIKADGAQRALASYNTKAEAEARLDELTAKNKDAKKSIHKKDGKFQKQR